jgi:MFS family permease
LSEEESKDSMELVVQMLLVLAALVLLFQGSQWGHWPKLVFSLGLGVCAFWLYPWVIEQSREQLNFWLSDPIIMQNLAVIQVVEALLLINIDLSSLKSIFGHPIKKYLKYAAYFPGIMWLAVILYVQMMVFYAVTDFDFDSLGLYISMGLGLGFYILSIVIKWLIPETHLRMELRYIFSFGQILGAVIVTVFCQVLPYQQQNSFELRPLIVVVLLGAIMFLIGWVWSIFAKRLNIKWKY